ncbi:ATP-binding protein [Eubacterium oxidoreducens]|uniref:AAA+ ATPase domain-containing protein n=1 Tax=Eubacterium oxidoreducens TaxID=1732 RepID=A0A1G6BQQ4_EUBOX|nr:AAA family ATPase [Eubacterium oxidoreducens]SDB22946.1 hypothetical protein SAMN02910417_01694 [Eubacterium oxidoreducens]
MLKRIIEDQINDWIRNGRKALLVDGARQVGKTYSIRKCLQESGRDYVEINLLENEEVTKALALSKSVRDLTVNISIATGHNFIKGETIVFIDEVQELKEVVTLIKFWVDEGSYRYVLSGSLLGIKLHALRSAPVGYVHEIKMYPLNFTEFSFANGITETVWEHVKKCFFDKTPVGENIHNKMMTLFQRYLIVGGMPQAVQEFVDNGNIGRVSEIQRDIIEFYKRDFTKYEDKNKRLILTKIYESIPAQLLKQNRRFNYADIKKGLRFERVENSFVWLYKAGVILHAFNTTEPKISLKLNEKSNLVKLYYGDVGLLTYMYGDTLRKEILFGEGRSNLGGIFENFVIQELSTHEYDVYYYNSKKMGELDFVIEDKGTVLPIEVKSGKDYYYHSAINNVIKSKEFDIKSAVVFTSYDISIAGNISYLPIYMTSLFASDRKYPILDPIEF